MRFDEKLMILRRKQGMSQEQLADCMGVTRQSVSKWESGQALPEMAKIIALSEKFGVSVDYLVKDYIEDCAVAQGHSEYSDLEAKVEEIRSYIRGYQFTSRTKIAGIPLVSIRLSRSMNKNCVAKGIIAIGNISIGVVSIGLVSAGILSFGCLALGLLAIGAIAVGLAALGAAAFGVLAIGSVAAGIYAGGVAVYGKEIAVGVSAWGKTVIGKSAHGVNHLQYYKGITAEMVRGFLVEHHPKLWNPLLKLLSILGAGIE